MAIQSRLDARRNIRQAIADNAQADGTAFADLNPSNVTEAERLELANIVMGKDPRYQTALVNRDGEMVLVVRDRAEEVSE